MVDSGKMEDLSALSTPRKRSMKTPNNASAGIPVLKRRAPTFALLDGTFNVTSIACEATVRDCGVSLRVGMPLPSALNDLVVHAVDHWSRVLVPAEHLQVHGKVLVRVVPVAAVDGLRVGIFLEPVNQHRSSNWARDFYALSVREAEVLDLLLAGFSTAEIAAKLLIAPSTAADHIKRLLQKTNSSTRLELFTRVFR